MGMERRYRCRSVIRCWEVKAMGQALHKGQEGRVGEDQPDGGDDGGFPRKGF